MKYASNMAAWFLLHSNYAIAPDICCKLFLRFQWLLAGMLQLDCSKEKTGGCLSDKIQK